MMNAIYVVYAAVVATDKYSTDRLRSFVIIATGTFRGVCFAPLVIFSFDVFIPIIYFLTNEFLDTRGFNP